MRVVRDRVRMRDRVRRRGRWWVVVEVRVHSVRIAALLGSHEALDHKGRLAESRNLLFHGDAVLAVGSAAKHGLLLLVVVIAVPTGEKALESGPGTIVVARAPVVLRATNSPADGSSRFGSEAVNTAVDVADTNDGADSKSNGGHAKDHDQGLGLGIS